MASDHSDRRRRREVEAADVVPFGGAVDRNGDRTRRNPCSICDRSVSERWGDDICPFCKDKVDCDECDFRAKSPLGLGQHYAKSHPNVEKPEGLP